MAIVTTIEELKDYCLRRLGAPVINIEVDDVQAYDRIDDAIEYFIERHANGTTEVYYKHTITRDEVNNNFILLPKEITAVSSVLESRPSISGEVIFDVEFQMRQDFNNTMASTGMSNYYIAMSSLSLINNLMVPDKQFVYNDVTRKFTPRWKLNDVGSANLLKSGNDLSSADWSVNNAVATANTGTGPTNNQDANEIKSSAAGQFSISQTYSTPNLVVGTVTALIPIKLGTYSGPITITIEDSTGTVISSNTVNPTNLWKNEYVVAKYSQSNANDIIVTISGVASGAGETFYIFNPWLYVNKILVIHGYSAVDPNTAVDLLNDRWIKKYTTALIKRQWGENIKKMSGIQLAGGVELNGQQIWDEANEEIMRIEEQFSLEYELPVDMRFA